MLWPSSEQRVEAVHQDESFAETLLPYRDPAPSPRSCSLTETLLVAKARALGLEQNKTPKAGIHKAAAKHTYDLVRAQLDSWVGYAAATLS